MPDEYRFFVDGRIPVLKLHYEPRPGPAVIVLHGLGVDTDSVRHELHALADRGLTAVGMDAPHHGARRDRWLDEMGSLGPSEYHERLLHIILESAPDVSRLIDHLTYEGHGPIGLAGISLGAYTALTVAARDSRVRATVSILGSPDWTPSHAPMTHALYELMQHAPVHRPQDLARNPLLFLNGGRDHLVLPHWARDFTWRVREQYPWLGQHVEYVEYPESEHFVRPQDWGDLWWRALNFLRWHLS
ncbi:alpha/beta hydrolase family protein [Hyalangium sp.]|uniref:alpha/beta hydrolase family protein n=1 Tax=Hyalangium sp. TaxID=2028555 RepID=UPI002D4AA1D5|nr:alpha/beta fold hydrolase [Hyalangium sp.]HYI01341.1 alpha/beta fold hydrolase [Hyalangium sp.]